MPDPAASDPLVALLLPVLSVQPDPDFAATLRGHLAEVVQRTTTSRPTIAQEEPMPAAALAANGQRHGDVSYVTVRVRDAHATRAFYGRLFGWTFDPGDPSPGSQVGGVRPQHGIIEAQPERGVVMAYRVDDLAAAVDRVRVAGGTATEPAQRPYGLEADCVDDQGISFYLHQLPAEPPGPGYRPRSGDVAYVSLGVPDLPAARVFYAAVLGWTFSAGSAEQGNQVHGVAPMAGLWSGGWTGARLAYRVSDIAAAMARVASLGGTAGPIEERPYGLACDDCADDQGAPFMLLQLED